MWTLKRWHLSLSLRVEELTLMDNQKKKYIQHHQMVFDVNHKMKKKIKKLGNKRVRREAKVRKEDVSF